MAELKISFAKLNGKLPRSRALHFLQMADLAFEHIVAEGVYAHTAEFLRLGAQPRAVQFWESGSFLTRSLVYRSQQPYL